MSDEPKFLIWSNEHAAWWRGGRAGYTKDITQAGWYRRQEARDICEQATRGWRRADDPPPELMVAVEDGLATLLLRWKQLEATRA